MIYIAVIIAIIALVGIYYGFHTGFRDAANPEAGEQPTQSRQQQQKGRRILWLSIIVFILIALWYGFIYESPQAIEKRQSSQTAEACNDILAAYNASQSFVREFLHTPSGAEFPIVPKPESKVIEPCEFEVLGTVFDREPEGEIKKSYQAELSYDLDNDRWQLQSLSINNEQLVP